MSDGITHYKYYKKGLVIFPFITLLVWGSTIFYYWPPIEFLLLVLEWASILYLFGRWIDPDLDQAGTSAADSRMVKEIPGLGYFLYLYWTSYALLMSALVKTTGESKGHLGAHRTSLTHSYFGTFLRVVWFNIPIVAILLFIKFDFTNRYLTTYFAGCFLAFALSDTIHYIHDGIWRKPHGRTTRNTGRRNTRS